MEELISSSKIKNAVKEHYGQAALHMAQIAANCCGSARSMSCCPVPIGSDLYDDAQGLLVPEDALLASLGCGNPTVFAELKPGQTVLDLGSGGGLDALLAARLVGPTGRVYGLDMTDEMLTLARDNQRKARARNARFVKGEIEDIRSADSSVDVIISNCAINLSWDKDRVLSEAFRVLKPGGCFAMADVVLRGELPSALRQNMLLWVCCIAGALQDIELIAKIEKAGFTDISFRPAGNYNIQDAKDFLTRYGVNWNELAPQVQDKPKNVSVRARKPGKCFSAAGASHDATHVAWFRSRR